MILRHTPTYVVYPSDLDVHCHTCNLTFSRSSWVVGKGHRHEDADPILSLLKKALNGRTVQRPLPRRRK